MAVKRKIRRLRHGDIIDIEEYHDGRYGAPGKKREKRGKPTSEQMQIVNAVRKMRICRLRLLQYFNAGDCYAAWTYEVHNRPPDMETALKHFQKAMRYVRREYKKRGRPLYWIRNIECGTRGAWHIHLVVNEIGDTASILTKAWEHGGTYVTEIRKSKKFYDEDFTKLANYMTKDEHTRERKKDKTLSERRIREANYHTSRNMPLPEPKVDKLVRWKKEPKSKKGYYIASMHEGINPVTGYRYRRYTMIRLEERRSRHAERKKIRSALIRGSGEHDAKG